VLDRSPDLARGERDVLRHHSMYVTLESLRRQRRRMSDVDCAHISKSMFTTRVSYVRLAGVPTLGAWTGSGGTLALGMGAHRRQVVSTLDLRRVRLLFSMVIRTVIVACACECVPGGDLRCCGTAWLPLAPVAGKWDAALVWCCHAVVGS
jgi:hypothetical protein